MPSGLANVTVISAQALHSLALRSNGTVVAWGYGPSGEASVPSGLSNVAAIAAGYQFNLAARADGTVAAWGDNSSGQTNVPAGLSNVVDVAAGPYHSLALLKNGTVVAWGDGSDGETNVPVGLNDVVAIAAGGDPFDDVAYSLALKSDGTVVKWGEGEPVSVSVAGLSNVIAIAAGADHALAIRTGPRTPVITLEPTDQYQVAGGTVAFTSKGVGLYGVSYQWQANGVNLPGATKDSLTLTNVQAEARYNVIVSDQLGSITSSNANLHLVTPPVILSRSLPTNQTVHFQSTVTLGVTATAPGYVNGFPLAYQWLLNGTNIAGASNASYTFLATSGPTGTYSVGVTNAAGSTNAAWQVGVIYDTLAYHLATNAVGHAAGYNDPSNATVVVYGYSQALTNTVWSTTCWLHGAQGLSATCIGWSNGLPGIGLVTMVSPRHYLFSEHTHPEKGAWVAAFLDTNNVVQWRKTLERVFVADDTSVGILEADLPSAVGYLPVMPSDSARYLPTNSSVYVQGIGMNQEMRAFSQPITFQGDYPVNWSSSAMIPFGLGTNWSFAVANGDSSAPERFLIQKRLVLASHNWATRGGPDYAAMTDATNQAMHYLSTNNNVRTDYQLTLFSLTNWPALGSH